MMSKLEELIAELCPDGVEYYKIGQICYVEKGKTPIQKAEPGEYPLVTTAEGRLSCNTYQFDCEAVCIPLISSRGHGVASLNKLYYQSGKFALGNILCAVMPLDSDKVDAKFLCIYLNHKKDVLLVPLMRGGANVSLTTDSLKNVKVPLPPLEIQREIVHILDEFTLYQNELAARKKQYEYYRDSFLNINKDDATVQWMKLGEACNMKSGKAISATKISNILTETNNVKCFGGNGLRGYVAFKSHAGSYPIIGRQGALCGNVNYAEGDFYATEHAVVVDGKTNCLPRYLYHLLTVMDLNQYKSAGAQPGLAVGKLEQLSIPVPSLAEQQRIVAILDRFDKLCNDISEGLPAEIELRRKQYEYYRDKLLTFKVKEA